ncbi:MAG: hypothetical protein IT381_24090 [Deltaproteobacteria bacterium]|nr:hypothetical protein [Deltaproteobacteria bacterium]
MSAQATGERRIITAVFPSLNKQETLSCVKSEIKRRSYTNRVRIAESHTVSAAEWQDLSENLLSRRGIWAGKGGTESAYQEPAELTERNPLTWPDEERRRWLAASNLIGIEIVNAETGERFVVDPQGYDYARYVGVP